MRATVVVDDGLIMALLNDVKIAEQIPCFYNKREMFRKAASGCGCCGQKKLDKQRQEMRNIKACLAGLSPDKKQLLKTRLNAETIRVFYVDGAGKTVQLTF